MQKFVALFVFALILNLSLVECLPSPDITYTYAGHMVMTGQHANGVSGGRGGCDNGGIPPMCCANRSTSPYCCGNNSPSPYCCDNHSMKPNCS